MLTTNDLTVLCCPACQGSLTLSSDSVGCQSCQAAYPIVDGIPRFIGKNHGYNTMWDYKWTVLDGGKGFNYEILKRDSTAFKLHNAFQFFENDPILFKPGFGRTAADIGCGTGQYAVSLIEKGAERVYAIDLTRGVDVGQKIIRERYPQYKDRIVFIQGDARRLPLKTNSVDLGMALASIHHSGALDQCIGEVVRVTKPQKNFFIWIYAKPLVPFGDAYRTLTGWMKLNMHLAYFSYVELIFNIVKRLPEGFRMPLLRLFASDTFYALRRLPLIGRFFMYLLPGVSEHPDKGYRLINLYDAYSPAFSEASDEGDFIRWSQKYKFRILSFSTWRLGIVGLKTEADA